LDHRSQGGMIEFLVRYQDRRIAHDIWVKSTDLTCYHKILEHYDRKVPSDIAPRQFADAPSVPPIPPEDRDSGIAVVGIEPAQNGDIHIKYQMGDEQITRRATRSEFAQLYRTQFSKCMIETFGKRLV
jgi:hypothetical protein